MVDVIYLTIEKCPVYKESIDSLKHLPFKYKLHKISDKGRWAELINKGIQESTGDILIMDDDVILNRNTFKGFDKKIADIIGFRLLFPNGKVQHGGCVVRNGQVEVLADKYDKPIVVPHCTASLQYINRDVIHTIGGMSLDYPGYQFEDVDFCFRALQAGLKIVCLPNEAIHCQGATKEQDKEFSSKALINNEILKSKFLNNPKFIKVLNERRFDIQ